MTTPLDALVCRLDDRRAAVNAEFFPASADRIARLCHRIAERFARGGRLIAVGQSAAACSDAHHVAVEFVHPVIVGKRALPALAVTAADKSLTGRVDLLARADDIVIVFDGGDTSTTLRDAVSLARERGCLTLAFAALGAEWEFPAASEDPFIAQEVTETLYHILWELVHVFFDHRGLLDGVTARQEHDVGAASFLYPFLRSGERGLDAVITDVRNSVLLKAAEVNTLRHATLEGSRDELVGAAAALRAAFDVGATLIAFGNGGSATDAMDVVADFHTPPHGWQPRRALDLTEDTAIITAIANDIGTDAIFSRQIIAYAQPGDIALALSTSGNSRNVIQALAEARTRGLVTVAMVGYDGGKVAAERLADWVIVTPSEHIPRIQEAQASAYHVLRELVERVTV